MASNKFYNFVSGTVSVHSGTMSLLSVSFVARQPRLCVCHLKVDTFVTTHQTEKVSPNAYLMTVIQIVTCCIHLCLETMPPVVFKHEMQKLCLQAMIVYHLRNCSELLFWGGAFCCERVFVVPFLVLVTCTVISLLWLNISKFYLALRCWHDCMFSNWTISGELGQFCMRLVGCKLLPDSGAFWHPAGTHTLASLLVVSLFWVERIETPCR